MKLTIVNSQLALSLVTVGEFNTEPSMTVPDQHITIEELMKRSSVGTMVLTPRTAVFNDDIVVRDARFIDPVDLVEIRQQVLERKAAADAAFGKEKAARVKATLEMLADNAKESKKLEKKSEVPSDVSKDSPSGE